MLSSFLSAIFELQSKPLLKMKFLIVCFAFFCAISGFTKAGVVGRFGYPDYRHLKGVTILNHPFTMKKSNGGYSGYSVDVMELIAKKVGFIFSMTLSPDGFYGAINENGTMNGMLGEVQQKRADFAIADITVTGDRAKYVDFTEPIMESTLGAIFKTKHLPAGATTMKDLLKSNLNLLVLQSGFTAATFQNGNSSLANAFWERFQSKTGGFVKNSVEGMKRVKTSATPEAYITQMSTLKYVVEMTCPHGSYTVLSDDAHLADIQYAIALQKGSQWLAPFNRAIMELKETGKLTELKVKHWIENADQCKSKSK